MYYEGKTVSSSVEQMQAECLCARYCLEAKCPSSRLMKELGDRSVSAWQNEVLHER